MRVALYVPQIPDGNSTPPLGPLYLLAVLEQDGFQGRLFDARIDRRALRNLLEFEPDLVGISAVTPGYLGGLRAARRIKETLPNVRVIFGGPHPTSLPEQVALEPTVDGVLLGESEISFLDLCRRYREGETSRDSMAEVKNLAFRQEGEVVLTARSGALGSEELERLPWPAFHLMDLDGYFAGSQAHGLFRRGKRVLPLMSTRGCPHGCTFCCRVLGRALRRRSVDSVMAEVHHLIDRYGIDELYFEDDNFTIDRERALEILGRLAALKPPIHVKFANGVRADRVDGEMLAAMREAHVYTLSFGIESGCPDTLKKMNKNLELGKARETVLLAKSMGFLVGANCILGYPGETVPDIEKSLDFFLGLPLDSMAIVNLIPFPGTEARSLCEREGYLTEEARNWDNYYFSINNPIPLIETPALPAEELVRQVHRAYRRMYLQPRWLWRSLRQLSPGQILAGAGVMLGVRGQTQRREPLEP